MMDTSTVYVGLILSLCLLGYGLFSRIHRGGADGPVCPCSDPKYCERIKDTTRKEIFVFSLNAKNDDWRFYNWSKVTTVVMVGFLDIDLVCLAHKHGARAMIIGNVGTDTLTNTSAKAMWINHQLQIVKDNYLDGINFDYESAILQNQTDVREGYTNLVTETTAAFKKYDPALMLDLYLLGDDTSTSWVYFMRTKHLFVLIYIRNKITVDVAWSPDCIDLRCYDYLGLSKSSDFLFVMSYDEQSQILGKCIAGANSGFSRTISGVQRYLDIGVPANTLVLGVPWYGYHYPCLAMSATNECSIKKVPFRGVNCSDAAGKEINYSAIIKMLKNSTTGRIWDQATQSPYFNYKDPSSGILHQIWYDDPHSLFLKYKKAVDLDLRGVGMWNAECVDYLSTLPDEKDAVEQMWRAFPNYTRVL